MIGDPLPLFTLHNNGQSFLDSLTAAVNTVAGGPGAGVGAGLTPMRLLDLLPNGGSKRITTYLPNGGKITMTINHSESRENSPYVTRRTVIRLDLTKVDANGKTVTQSSYNVTTDPVGCAAFGMQEQPLHLLQSLSFFTLFGSFKADGSLDAATEGPAIISRVLAGEP